MAINKKLIHFETLAKFQSADGINTTSATQTPTNDLVGNIPYHSIVFIKDSCKFWTHGKYYDCNNTWRGILNNLTSTSTTDSLSAYQGKILNEKFANYLPLSGGTLTGALTMPSLTVTGASTFSQTINGSILGNAATASRLLNARTITIGSLSNSFDGSANISYSLASMGAFASSSFTLANIKSTLGISDWALASSKPSYNFSEIGAGTAVIGDGANYLLWRSNASCVSGVYYHTTGNEAVVFGNVNANTSWIFATTNPKNRADWTTLTPSLQIKNGKVAINKLIANGANLTYALEVNGDVQATNFRGNLVGNASTVTNGVYTTGDQTISGNKSFSGSTSLDDATIGNLVVTGGASFALTINGTIDKALKDGSGNTIASTYVKKSGDTMSGLLTVTTGSNHAGIKAGDTYINSIGGELILQNNTAIRFGGDSWNWNVWAGLKYVHSSKIIYLGLADNSAFTANSALSGGKLYTPGISNIYIGNGTNLIWHAGNDGSESGLDADLLDGYHAGVNNGNVGIFVPWPGTGTMKDEGLMPSEYGTQGYGHPDEVYLKSICKWAIAHYTNSADVTLIGSIAPNSSGTCILHLYSSSGKDSTTLLPRYCSGTYTTLGGYIYNFGTVDYNWYYRQVSAGYASSAGAVAWDNVSSKPATATRWPSWSEVTSKPNVVEYDTSTTRATVDGTNNYPHFYNLEGNNLISGYLNYWYVLNMGKHTGNNFASLIAMNYQSAITDTDMFIRTANGSNWRAWRRVLHDNNYSSYALPLSGGTMTGSLTVPSLTVNGASTFSQAINASILGNAATASRLLNTRSIFGQSFDGSGNVSGNLTASHIYMGGYLYMLFGSSWLSTIDNDGNGPIFGHALAINNRRAYYVGSPVYICGGSYSNYASGITVNSSNNIGIGTTSPSYKLHVNGGLLAITNNSNTVTIGSQNSAWCHIESGKQFYMSNSVWVNGTLGVYNGGSCNYYINNATSVLNDLRVSGSDLYIGSASGSQCHLQYDSTNKVLKFLFD